MRGILFTEYLDFIEARIGDEALEGLLLALDGKISGAYTSVGNYKFEEFAVLHTAVCGKLAADGAELAREFGYNLLGRFYTLFPEYFSEVPSGMDFLDKLGSHIHEEVKKLYPDAKPPDVALARESDDRCILHYYSHRPLAPVARGLTEACLDHFGDPYRVVDEIPVEGGTHFVLEKK